MTEVTIIFDTNENVAFIGDAGHMRWLATACRQNLYDPDGQVGRYRWLKGIDTIMYDRETGIIHYRTLPIFVTTHQHWAQLLLLEGGNGYEARKFDIPTLGHREYEVRPAYKMPLNKPVQSTIPAPEPAKPRHDLLGEIVSAFKNWRAQP